MPSYAERKAEEQVWECFAKQLGLKIEDITPRTGDCLVSKSDGRASIPRWLRDLILAKTTWREQASATPIKAAG